MTSDRVHPSTKLAPPPAAITGTGQAKTTQLYNPNRPRPIYRQPQNPRRRRRICCLCFIYTLIFILSIILLFGIAACIFYALYHPKHPTFAVSSLRISKFNLTGADSSGFSHLNSRLDFTITAKNPNKNNIRFVYDPISIGVEAGGVDAGNATVPGFTHTERNTTVIRGTVASDPSRSLDSDSVAALRKDKKGFPVTVEIDTKVRVQMGKIKSKSVGIRVICAGIRGTRPKNATAKIGTPATTTRAKCKVDLRIKIWKFTF